MNIKCKHCTMEIPSESKTCPCCGGKIDHPKNIYVVIFIGLIILISGLYVINFLYSDSYQNISAPSVKEIKRKQISNNHKTTQNQNTTLEYKLASIDAGYQVSNDNISINRFRSLLSQLSDTFTEDKQKIADMTVTAQEILKNDGIKENIITIMEGMNQIMPSNINNVRYAEYVSAYVTLRHKGQSHTDAILALQAMIRRMVNN